jgi:hypothetical protein
MAKQAPPGARCARRAANAKPARWFVRDVKPPAEGLPRAALRLDVSARRTGRAGHHRPRHAGGVSSRRPRR